MLTGNVKECLRKIAARYVDQLGDLGSPALRVARPFIAQLEGTRLNARNRHSVYKDIKGIETIGYGLTDQNLINKYRDMGMPEKDAQRFLHNRIAETEDLFRDLPAWRKLNPNQQAALLSWGYNVGRNAVKNSTIMKHLQADELEKIPGEFGRWQYVRKYDNRFNAQTPNVKTDKQGRFYIPQVVQGLKNRRDAELALWNQAPKPTPPSV